MTFWVPTTFVWVASNGLYSPGFDVLERGAVEDDVDALDRRAAAGRDRGCRRSGSARPSGPEPLALVGGSPAAASYSIPLG